MKVNLNFMICVTLELDRVVMTYDIIKTPIRREDTSFKSMKTTV